MSDTDKLAELKRNRDYWNTKLNEARSTLSHIDASIAKIEDEARLRELADITITDRDEQRAYMLRAFCWLQAPQADESIVDHLGLYSEKHFSFCGMHDVVVGVVPVSNSGRPCFIFESRYFARKKGLTVYQPFTEAALDYCRDLIKEFSPIFEEWNGKNGKWYLDTFSISPAIRISNELLEARHGYSKHFDFSYSERFNRGTALLQKPLGWR